MPGSLGQREEGDFGQQTIVVSREGGEAVSRPGLLVWMIPAASGRRLCPGCRVDQALVQRAEDSGQWPEVWMGLLGEVFTI